MSRTVLIVGVLSVFLLLVKTKTVSAKALTMGVPLNVAYLLPENSKYYLQALHDAEIKNNLPAGLLVRMAYQESRFRDDIISGETKSRAGAVGIMQIVPKWHPGVNPYNAFDSIAYAGEFVKKLYDQFGDWQKALAAYNWGPGNVKKYYMDGNINALPTETKNYVLEIGGDVGLLV